MPRSEGTLNISYGICADPIDKQITAEGYYLPEKRAKYYEKCRQAACQLKFILNDSLNDKIIQRINKELAKEVQKYLLDGEKVK